uniref:Uncharacterized protein n=1 Tax=viral metagenome TaxID=1070528 RepID=A0A2V0RAX9_9ZZZZ
MSAKTSDGSPSTLTVLLSEDYKKVADLAARMCHRGESAQPFKPCLDHRLFVTLEKADLDNDKGTVMEFITLYPRFTHWWILNTNCCWRWETVICGLRLLGRVVPPILIDECTDKEREIQQWIIQLTRLKNPDLECPARPSNFHFTEVATGSHFLETKYEPKA